MDRLTEIILSRAKVTVNPALLTVEDLDVLCDEATRQGRSLACLIGALEGDGEPIAWMAGEGLCECGATATEKCCGRDYCAECQLVHAEVHD